MIAAGLWSGRGNKRDTASPMAMASVRFLIIDDHPLFRDALQSAIAPAYPKSETLEAASVDEAVDILVSAPSIDLALLDLKIPGVRGFEGLLQLRTQFPKVPIVVISGMEEQRIAKEVISFGAAGFIPKSFKKTELALAIKQVMEGTVYLPPDYDDDPQDEDEQRHADMIQRISQLTPQQLRVLHMLQDGLLNKQIAYELQVSETTVKAHVSEILRKLGVISRTQAAMEASKLSGEDLMRAAEGFPQVEA